MVKTKSYMHWIAKWMPAAVSLEGWVGYMGWGLFKLYSSSLTVGGGGSLNCTVVHSLWGVGAL